MSCKERKEYLQNLGTFLGTVAMGIFVLATVVALPIIL